MASYGSTGLKLGAACLMAVAWQFGGTATAQAQLPPAAPPGAAPAAAPAGPTALSTPVMAGPISGNPDPINIDSPGIGTIYISGAGSTLFLKQTAPVGTFLGMDKDNTGDLSNLQMTFQNTEGLFQFFLEPGVYALPTLGAPYRPSNMTNATDNLFGGLPVAWGKIAPTDTFNIQGGKLPTLIGVEAAFTFQNMNIERGLLWAQEPLISKGVQANLTTGPVAWALSWNDGFYSGEYNWLSGAATWTIDPVNTVVVSGGSALGRNSATTLASSLKNQFATPVAQNNSMLVTASYTYNNAPWTVTPYLQYTHVDTDAKLGIADADTFGGAILASYKFNDNMSLAGRWEYITSSGAATGAGLLGYGTGADAMSFTLTPTYQYKYWFLRGEGSIVTLSSTAPGLAFGPAGNKKTQGRFMVETGVVF